MFKRLALFALVIFSQDAFSQDQNTDSVLLVKTKWERQKIAPKAKLFTYHFNKKNLFASNQYLSYIEVKPHHKSPIIAIGNEIKVKKTTATFGIENQAIAAVNGTFFDVANGGSVDFVKVDGQVTNLNVLDKNGNRTRHQMAAIVIDEGRLALKKWENTANWENTLSAKDVMVSGPMLIFNKGTEVLDTTAFTRSRHPRTAIGLKQNGNVILLTADGRQENAAGLSLHELAKIMRWMGCINVINLDGGGSTTLWVSGYGENGVVNFPSDNKKWDHEGARKVANVILLKPRDKKR